MTDPQDARQTIAVADARAAVQASGLLEAIDGPHYLAHDEAEWRPYFTPSMAPTGHPLFARLVLTRQGQKPREVVISWDEYAEIIGDDDAANEREAEWNDTRKRKPMLIFGAEAERHAYRVVFADVLAKLEAVTAQIDDTVRRAEALTGEPWEPKGEPVRDWHADLAATSTKAEVDALFEEARAAKALKDAGLHEAFTRRLRDVLATRTPTEAVREIVAETAAEAEARVPQPRVPTVPSPAVVAAKVKPLTVNPPRRPQGDRPQGQRRRSKSR